MSYFVARDGHQIGPVSVDQINQGLAKAFFSLTDLCWTQGMAEWLPLSSLIAPARDPAPVPLARVPPPLPREIKPLNLVPVPPAASTFSLPLAAAQPFDKGEVKGSGPATASLICGVLALAVGIFAFPAIICGHIAWWQVRKLGKSSKYRWRVWVGLVLGYGRIVFVLCSWLFLLGIALGWFPKPTPESRVKDSINAIVAELDTYAGDHWGSYPATLEGNAKAAKLVGDFSKLFTPPKGWSEEPGFTYVGAGGQRSGDASRTPILMSVCHGPMGERVVINKDGSVMYCTLGHQF